MSADSQSPRATDQATGPTEVDAVPGILAQVGLIITPASLIALFCGVLDVSARSTAAVSLLSVFLTTNCIYRKRLNRIIPSSLMVGLLIACAAVFFFSYQNILLKDTGLIMWYRHSNDYLSEIAKDIDESKQEIWFFGTDFNITAGERRNDLLKKLGQGLKVRFLIFDPLSPHLTDLAADFDQSPDELRSECQKGLSDLAELQKRWQAISKQTQTPGELDIRVFDTHPHARIYVFDPQRSQGKTLFIPYVNVMDSAVAPAYLLQNVQTGVFVPYYGAIQKLWLTSETIDQHLQNPRPIH